MWVCVGFPTMCRGGEGLLFSPSIVIIIFLLLQKYRITQFLAHFLSAVLLGLVFINTGNDASMVRSNLTFIFGVLIFVMFTGKMTVTTASKKENFPLSLSPASLSLLFPPLLRFRSCKKTWIENFDDLKGEREESMVVIIIIMTVMIVTIDFLRLRERVREREEIMIWLHVVMVY